MLKRFGFVLLSAGIVVISSVMIANSMPFFVNASLSQEHNAFLAAARTTPRAQGAATHAPRPQATATAHGKAKSSKKMQSTSKKSTSSKSKKSKSPKSKSAKSRKSKKSASAKSHKSKKSKSPKSKSAKSRKSKKSASAKSHKSKKSKSSRSSRSISSRRSSSSIDDCNDPSLSLTISQTMNGNAEEESSEDTVDTTPESVGAKADEDALAQAKMNATDAAVQSCADAPEENLPDCGTQCIAYGSVSHKYEWRHRNGLANNCPDGSSDTEHCATALERGTCTLKRKCIPAS